MRAPCPGLWCCLLCLPCLFAAASGDAHAQQVVIYRCTDASGHVTLQNDQACPSGTREQKQVVDAPPTLPAYVPPATYTPAIVAKDPPTQAASSPLAAREPPPALFQCRSWDQTSYYTDASTPREHCAPLRVVGIDGVSRPQASACETVADQCEAVPAETLCHAWKQQVDEAEFRWRFAGAKDDDDRRREYEKLATILANSDCNP